MTAKERKRMKRFGVVLVTLLASSAAIAGAARSALPDMPTYRKPFLSGGGAAVGGYMDLEFLAGDDGSTFDQHRFVPFIYAEVSDRVHVASEIEFEHGGFVSGEGGTDGEIKIEFAHVDFTVNEALNVRGGVILSPVGRLNVLHDAPMLDLTDRPLVNRYVIPTTLSESGLGVFGVVYPGETWVVDYEAYLVNGFGDATVTGAGGLDLRGGRGSQKQDNNNARSAVGRLGVSPRLGTEFGVSLHTGSYDAAGDRNLTLAAVDARFAGGPFEFLGEGALARADLADSLLAGDAAQSAGFYLEGKAHVLAGAIASLPQSVFTAVARVDYVDRDRETDGSDRERLTLGFNFRPTEQTVFKNDVLFDRSRGAGETEWSDTETGYRFSIATYF
jgi:hypothetical protein